MDIETGVEIVGNSTTDRQIKTQALINFLPIIAMDEDGEMHYLDAKDAVNIINYTTARKVVDEGFMSNSLFNVKALFRMKGKDYERVREIMSEILPVSDSDKRKNKKQQGEPLAEENPEDTFEIEKEKVISQSGLGEKKFAAIEEATSGDENLDLVLEMATERAGEEITKEDLEKFEQAKKPFEEAKEKQKNEEKKFRDHLRGFARTIPVLLMAYAHSEMTFKNFEKRIPQVDFEQVTGITKEQFEYLRQARDDSGEPIFVEGAFNSAIHEFLRRKRATEHYYKSKTEDDIYDNIPSQENNRVFTSKRVVNMMLDAFEAENPGFFKSDKVKILDPYVKSGNFLAEAAKRFYKYSKDKDIKRIIENQLFGIAPFDIYATLAQETVYGFADIKFKHHLRNRNIRPEPQIEELVKAGKLEEVIKEHFGNMKFDVVIGNPPYQEGNYQIYTDFYVNAIKQANYVCLIFPTGWQQFKTANGLKKMNDIKIKRDNQIVHIDNRQNVFEGVAGAEWTNIILWKRFYNNGLNGKQRILLEGEYQGEVLLPTSKSDIEKPEEIFSIADKVGAFMSEKISSIGSARKPYGFEADPIDNPQKYNLTLSDSRTSHYNVRLFGNKSRKRTHTFIERSKLVKESEMLESFKIFVPKAWGNMDERKGYLGGAFSEILVAKPFDACSEMYIEFGPFNNIDEAKNAKKYFYTKFFRAVFYKDKTSQNTARDTYRSVPLQNFTNNSDIDWSQPLAQIDQQLYKKYGLSEKEIAFIEEKVKEME